MSKTFLSDYLLFPNQYAAVPLEEREPWRTQDPSELHFGLKYYKWMSEHYEVPAILTLIYVCVVFGIKAHLKDRPPVQVTTSFAIWNFGLGIFSMIGAYYVVPPIIVNLWQNGISHELCTLESEHQTMWNFLFCLSKIPELVDTVFLVLKKGNLRFLHWYHHIATMWYCWDSFAVQVQNGSTFAGMNLIVHSVMYTYYGLTALKYRFSNTVRKSITNIQVSQMLFGISIILHNIYKCNDHPLNLYLGLAMYISYAYLFIKLWIDEYVKKGGAKKAE